MSFGLTSKTLPEKFLRLLSAEDRFALGTAGLTAQEAIERAEANTERKLQDLMVNYLMLYGITAIRSRMDKKTTNNPGTPDLLFAVVAADGYRYPIAVEVKLPGKSLDDDQVRMQKDLTTGVNGWCWYIAFSVADLREILRSFGLKPLA